MRTTDNGQATGNLYHLRCESRAPFWYLQRQARTHIKGSYPKKFPSIWALSNLVVSKIPLYSTNYVNNRHRLIWTLCKNTFKLDEKVKSLKFWKFGLFGLFRSILSRKSVNILPKALNTIHSKLGQNWKKNKHTINL